jgi:hypothetical protein
MLALHPVTRQGEHAAILWKISAVETWVAGSILKYFRLVQMATFERQPSLQHRGQLTDDFLPAHRLC